MRLTITLPATASRSAQVLCAVDGAIAGLLTDPQLQGHPRLVALLHRRVGGVEDPAGDELGEASGLRREVLLTTGGVQVVIDHDYDGACQHAAQEAWLEWQTAHPVGPEVSAWAERVFGDWDTGTP